MEEVWMPVLDYEGLYEASNLGDIKSLWFGKSKILSKSIDGDGYYKVNLCKNGKITTKNVHKLVYESFYGKTNLQIDHKIENNKLDNRLDNLQAITPRENTSKYKLTKNKTSKYIGVCFKKSINKWVAQIRINGKRKHIGIYLTEIEASNAYQQELLKLNQ